MSSLSSLFDTRLTFTRVKSHSSYRYQGSEVMEHLRNPAPKHVRPRLSEETGLRLWRFCVKHNLAIKLVAAEAINQYIERYESEQAQTSKRIAS